jgi:hypothetical protein
MKMTKKNSVLWKWQKKKNYYRENDKKKFTMKMTKKNNYENDKKKFTMKMTKNNLLYKNWLMMILGLLP